MIIGLHGYARSGKDSLAQVLVEDFGYTRISFADILRDALYRLNPIVHATLLIEGGAGVMRLRSIIDSMGWDKAKTEFEEVRRLLQVIGLEVGRELFYEDVWVDAALKNYEPSGKYVITDVRFENEVLAVENRKGVLVKIIRDGVGPVNNHVSDAGLPDHSFDIILNNSGTLNEWHDQAVALVKDAADVVSRRAIDLPRQPRSTSHYGLR